MPLGRVLDPLHIFVAEPEMMPDLVDQHMADHLVTYPTPFPE